MTKSKMDRYRFYLPSELAERLTPEARRRKCTVERLVNKLMQTIADDKMIDAILDDGH